MSDYAGLTRHERQELLNRVSRLEKRMDSMIWIVPNGTEWAAGVANTHATGTSVREALLGLLAELERRGKQAWE